jgi:hypothetical protein
MVATMCHCRFVVAMTMTQSIQTRLIAAMMVATILTMVMMMTKRLATMNR